MKMGLNKLNTVSYPNSMPERSYLSAVITGFFSVATSPQHILGEPDLLASGCSSA